jgi:hypothetical protein
MDATENLSIVKVDKRPYRIIAQENWGLTDEQMKGKHVHHRIPVAEGGTNDPSNLYVCSPSFHAWAWHGGRFALITDASEVARLGGLAGGRKGGTRTRDRKVGIFSPDHDRSAVAKVTVKKSLQKQRENGLGLFGLSTEDRSKNTRKQWEGEEFQQTMTEVGRDLGTRMVEERRGAFAPENLGKGAKTTNSTLWFDPSHPELGAHHFNKLSRLQRENGLPCGKNNRVKFTK